MIKVMIYVFEIVTSCSMFTNVKAHDKSKIRYGIRQVKMLCRIDLPQGRVLNGTFHGLSWIGLAASTTPC